MKERMSTAPTPERDEKTEEVAAKADSTIRRIEAHAQEMEGQDKEDLLSYARNLAHEVKLMKGMQPGSYYHKYKIADIPIHCLWAEEFMNTPTDPKVRESFLLSLKVFRQTYAK